MFKNVAGQKVTLLAIDTATNLPKTGDSANITAYVSKDDGAVTVLTDTTATEKDATNAPGLYDFDVSQTESNADKLVFSAKSSTSGIRLVPVTVYTRPNYLSSLSIDSSGRVDVAKIAGTAQTARDIGASVLISSGTGTGQISVTSGVISANVTQYGGSAGTFASGRPEVNATHWGGTAVASATVRANAIQFGSQTVTASAGVTVGAFVGNATAALSVDASGRVTVGSNADKTGYSLSQSFPTNFSSLAISGAGKVTVGTNDDKTGYALTQTFPTNFSSLAITVGGAVTVGTNSDKTGYSLTQAFPTNFSSLAITAAGKVTVGTNDDKTGYSLSQSFPSNFASLVISAGGVVSADAVAISGDTVAADNLELAADGTGYNLGGGSIVAASVTGAVGSVTGAVGSVTGNVGGNVTGSVGSVVGNVGGNVSGNVAGSVNSVTSTVTANVTQFGGTNGTFSAGRPEVNATHWGGTAVGSAAVRANAIQFAGQTITCSAGVTIGVYVGGTGAAALEATSQSVKGVTDKLDTAMELDSTAYRFTTNALEQAPSGGGGSTDWTADERTVIRAIFGIPGSGTTPADPTTGILDTIRDKVDAAKAVVDGIATNVGTPVDLGVGATLFANQQEIHNDVNVGVSRIGTPTNLGSGASLADNLVDIESQTDDIGSAGAGLTAITNVLGSPAGASVSADIAAVKSDTNTLLGRITSTLFSGITYLSRWLAIGYGKTADSTTLAEVNATTAGASYDNTTDSPQAIRDRGDLSWATATGFSTHSAADVWAVGTRTITGGTITTYTGNTPQTGDAHAYLTSNVGTNGANLTAADDAVLSAVGALSIPTAGAIADAVWDEAISGHLTAGTTGAKLNSLSAGGDATAANQTIIITHLTDIKGSGFSSSTDTLEKIRDALPVSTGAGAYTLTVTVNDGTTALQNATVRLSEGANAFAGLTNASGVVAFSLDAATYDVAITKDGYSFNPTTKVVAGSGSQTYSMTAVVITPSADPLKCVATMTCFNNLTNDDSAARVWLQQTSVPTGDDGHVFDGKKVKLTPNSDGEITVTLWRGAGYKIWRGSSEDDAVEFTAASAATMSLDSVLGKD